MEEISNNKYNQGGLTLKDLKPDTFESNEKSKLCFRQWSDEFSSWVERIDQDFETMLRLVVQMQEWDKDKFIAGAQQDYRLKTGKVAEFVKHIHLVMKRLTAGIAREIVDTSKTAEEVWYRLTDRFHGRNVQGATAIASQLQELKQPSQSAESFHVLTVIRKLVRDFARQSPKEPMPSAIVKAAYMRVVPETYRRAMETQVDVDKVEPHNLEDKVLAVIRNNTFGAAPMDWEHRTRTTSGSSDGELYGLQKGKLKGKSESFNGTCYNCGKSGHSAKFYYAKGLEKQKERERRETAKVGMTVKVGQSERDGQTVKVGTFQAKVGSNKRPAGMNNLERDSKQYDVLVMEMSTQEKTKRGSNWCVPVKHVAKLSRMRGSTSTKTNIKFSLDPEEEDQDMTTPDCLGSKQFALQDDVSYKCRCCEAGGTQWKRTRNLTTKKSSVCFSSLTDADINFFEKENTDLRELQQQNTLGAVAKPLIVDSGDGETSCQWIGYQIMWTDTLTRHFSHPRCTSE